MASIVLFVFGTFVAYGAGAGYFSAVAPVPFSMVVAGLVEGGTIWVVAHLLVWALRRSTQDRRTLL
jgi:hypothetical protein